jgi:hypothetical protein
MNNQKFDLILDKLLEKTEEGKLEWKTTANEDTLLVVLKDSSVSVSYAFDSFDGAAEYYVFDFRNENGETVASITISNSSENRKEFEKAQKIFALARQNSFMNNKVIDRILEQLAA